MAQCWLQALKKAYDMHIQRDLSRPQGNMSGNAELSQQFIVAAVNTLKYCLNITNESPEAEKGILLLSKKDPST